MALKVSRNHYALQTCDGPAKASMAVRAFQISAAAMRAPVDDQWAFLELIDAPQWVDLSLEEALQGVEGDDTWFYRSHPYHEAPFKELDSLPGLQVNRSTSKMIAGEAHNEVVNFTKGDQRHPVSIANIKPKKVGIAATHGELNHMAKSQAWPRSKAKRIQLQPNQQVQEEYNKSPTIYEESTSASYLTANSGRKVVLAKGGGSADFISILMQRVRISDGLAMPSKLKEFDKVKPLSPTNKAKQSIEKPNQLEHSNLQTMSSTFSSSAEHNIDQVNSQNIKMEMKPQRQEKQVSKIQRSCDAATFVRSSKHTDESLTSSKSIMREDAKSGRKHDHCESLKLQACLSSPCVSEVIGLSADKISESFAFQDNEEKSNWQKGISEEINSKMADVSSPGPLKQKVLTFHRIKESQSATLRMSLPTIDFGKGAESANVDLVRSQDIKPGCMKGHLQAKIAGTTKLHRLCTNKAEIKTGQPAKLLNHNQKQSSNQLSTPTFHALASKKDSKTIKKYNKVPVMNEVKSRTYGAGEDDLAALIAEHNKKVRVVSKYEPRCHSMKDIKEWETRTGQQYYSLQPAEREKANQAITAFKRSL